MSLWIDGMSELHVSVCNRCLCMCMKDSRCMHAYVVLTYCTAQMMLALLNRHLALYVYGYGYFFQKVDISACESYQEKPNPKEHRVSMKLSIEYDIKCTGISKESLHITTNNCNTP